MRILVTGGAGFIGGHIVDKLLAKGYNVTIIDSLEPPTHIDGKPNYLPKNVRFIHGNLLEKEKILQALEGIDVIFHQAATGGFTENVSKYYEWNTLATARLWEAILGKKISLKKFIVASSVAVYGEGKYSCQTCGIVYPQPRKKEQLEKKNWELQCPSCNKILNPLPTDEIKPINPILHYSQSKYDQESISFIQGQKTNIPVVALRYFLVYGPRQSATNPYTGVCSLFATAFLQNKKPTIFEDGLQTRDFVYVEDVADANILVLEKEEANNKVFNVGTGIPISIKYIADTIAKELGKKPIYNIGEKWRLGDVRHIYADISSIKAWGFTPKILFEYGIKKYLEWLINKR